MISFVTLSLHFLFDPIKAFTETNCIIKFTMKVVKGNRKSLMVRIEKGRCYFEVENALIISVFVATVENSLWHEK